MFSTHNPRNRCAAAALGALGSLSSVAYDPCLTFGQERAFSLLAELNANSSTAQLPSPQEYPCQLSRVFSADQSTVTELQRALADPRVLRIVWGGQLKQPKSAAWEVELWDGSVIGLHLKDNPEFDFKSDAELNLRIDASGYVIPCAAIRSIRPARDIGRDLTWQELKEKTVPEDRLIIRREHGVLDEIYGTVTRFTTSHVVFQYDGETLQVPYNKIEGVIAATLGTSRVEACTSRGNILRMGSHVLHCETVEISEEQTPKALIRTQAGASLVLDIEPLLLDRTALVALTAQDMQISHVRRPVLSEDARSAHPAERLLHLPPYAYTVSGKELHTVLAIHGPAELTIKVPEGYTRLYYQVEFPLSAAQSVSFLWSNNASDPTLLYKHERFPAIGESKELEKEIALTAPGTLHIHVPPGTIRFTKFLLLKD